MRFGFSTCPTTFGCAFGYFKKACSLLVFSSPGDCCFPCRPCPMMLEELLCCSLWIKLKQGKYIKEWDLSRKFSLFSFVFSFHTLVVTSAISFPPTGEHCLFNSHLLLCLWQRQTVDVLFIVYYTLTALHSIRLLDFFQDLILHSA